jgi:hypothetical protein
LSRLGIIAVLKRKRKNYIEHELAARLEVRENRDAHKDEDGLGDEVVQARQTEARERQSQY